MKIRLIYLTALFLASVVFLHAQTVTISATNAPLEKIFTQIQAQTKYRFVYKWELLQQAKLVNIDVNNAPLSSVLSLCFRDQPLTYQIVDTVIIVSKKEDRESVQSTTADIDVRGRVVSENNLPVIATVSIKNTGIAVSTDNDGYFTIKDVKAGASLIITSVNIETIEIKINGRTDLGNIMTETRASVIDTVKIANTGYTKVNPNQTNAPLEVVTNKVINEQVDPNIIQRILNVSTVYFNANKSNNNPQSSLNITIRGPNSFRGPLDPLIVLDNNIYEGDITNINPNDVENVTILKDAGATSIYGPRGGNGVIVITTKKGSFNQKLKIEFNSTLLVTPKPDLYTLPQMSSSDYIDVEQFLFNNGYDFNGSLYSTPPKALTPAVEIFLKRKNGLISAQDSSDQINSLKRIDSRDQYKKNVYRDAVIQQYSLNLSGGNNSMAWIISGAYNRSVSNLHANDDKINLRINNTYKPIKSLLLNVGCYYTLARSSSGMKGYNSIQIRGRQVPYLRLIDEEGNPLSVSTTYRDSYLDTVGGGKLFDWKYYPFDDYKHNSSSTKREELVANLGLTYQVVRSLSIDITYQFQRQISSTGNLADVSSYYTRDLINRFSQIDASGTVKYIVPVGGIYTLSNSNARSQNFRTQLNFEKKMGKHSISAIGGFETRETVAGGNGATIYRYNEDPLTNGAVDYYNNYPMITGGFGTIGGQPVISPTVIHRFVSGYINADYKLKNLYSASISARRDGSNVFGVNTNDRWKPLWSAGLGWEISKEKFYRARWMPSLRLRTTWGYSGNVDLSKTALVTGRYGTNLTTNLPYLRINTLANPNLRWEQTRQWNIGLVFSLKRPVLSGSIDYYRKKGSDLYGPAPFDYTAGGSNTIIQNVADMSGQGLDALLQSNNLTTGPVKWTTNLIFAFNTNKTTNYFGETSQNGLILLGDGNTITPAVGKPLYAIAAYKWAGLNGAGDPQGFVDGHPSTDYNAILAASAATAFNSGSLKYIGAASPTVFGSLINTFSWKGFSASINIAYRLGYYFRKLSLNYNALYTAGLGHSDFAKRWQKPGDELITNVPAMVYMSYPNFNSRDAFYNFSEINVLRGDHVRLEYISLDYSIAIKKNKSQFDRVRVFANISNIGLLWTANKEHIDPENPYSYKTPTSFAAGIAATF